MGLLSGVRHFVSNCSKLGVYHQPFLKRKPCRENDFVFAKTKNLTVGVFAYPPETSTPFRGDMQKPPITIQRAQEQRDIPILRRRQSQHPLLKIIAMITGIAIGDRDDRCLGSWLCCSWCCNSILATHRERRRVHMDLICLHPKDLSCSARNACKQLGGIM